MKRLVAALFLFLCASLPAWATTAEVLGKGELAMYGSPSGRGHRGQVPAGAEVQVVEESGRAAKVRYKGAEGWVKRSRLRVKEEAPPPKAEAPAPAPVQAPLPAPVAAPATTAATGDRSYGSHGTYETQVPPPAAPAPAPPPAGGYLTQYDREEAAPKGGAGPGLFSAISALLLVLALVAGAVYLVKLFTGRRLPGGGKARGIQVHASRPLGPRQALLLVDVGGIPLLLAQSEGMVNLITEIRDPDAVRRLNELYGFRETPFETEFRGRLDLESGERPARAATPDEAPRDAGTPPAAASRPGNGPVPEEAPPTVEERLAALRRRKPGGEP